ncbi:MAG: amino acid permease [Candidatus Omnitrophica bacterium]|nr:amino acid permease [Candidatus Omnitrophota bacterium]
MTRPSLLRSLGLGDATMLVVGCIVGVGIFRTASSIANHLQSPPLILALWAIGGGLSLCGALCYAELAAMFPASGGDYVYITRVYGRFWGFLFGWTKLFIERTGTIAILGYVFAEYARRVLPYTESQVRLVASAAILALTSVNVLGVRWGKYVQNVFTVLKLVALGSLILAGIRAWTAFQPVLIDWTIPPLHASRLQSLGVALVFVLWTYGGWTEAAYVAEEIRNPTRTVPTALIAGVTLTTGLYLLVNWSYLLVIPITQLSQTPLVAAGVMQAAFGNAGAVFIAWMISCSAFGALNGYILTGGRILYAMGKDHALFDRLSQIHPAFHTPAAALWMNAAIAIGLVFTKTFEQIMTYSTVVISVFFTMAVFGVILLRSRRPKDPRPYRAWGYPITPMLFCLTMIGFIADVCVKEPKESAFGFLALAIGIPLYRWSQAARRAPAVQN